MKHINKSIFATTLLTSLFLGQPLLAGEKAVHGDFSGHSATSLQSEITAPKMMHAHQDQATRSETGDQLNWMKVKYMHNHEAYLEEMFPGQNR